MHVIEDYKSHYEFMLKLQKTSDEKNEELKKKDD